MITFAEGVAQAARGTLCALMAANDNINRLFANIGADPFGFYPAMSGLRRQLCSDDPDNDPVYEPPFTGGQCPGVQYNIFWEQRQFDGTNYIWVARSRIAAGMTGPLQIDNPLTGAD